MPPRRAVVLIDREGTFVSAVALHETDGAFVLMEDAVLNPEIPLGLRAEAAQVTLEQLRGYAAISGKLLVGMVRSAGLAKTMVANEFVRVPGVVMALHKLDAPVMATVFERKKAPEASTPGPSNEGRTDGRSAEGAGGLQAQNNTPLTKRPPKSDSPNAVTPTKTRRRSKKSQATPPKP
jgi:hypothetical protein